MTCQAAKREAAALALPVPVSVPMAVSRVPAAGLSAGGQVVAAASSVPEAASLAPVPVLVRWRGSIAAGAVDGPVVVEPGARAGVAVSAQEAGQEFAFPALCRPRC